MVPPTVEDCSKVETEAELVSVGYKLPEGDDALRREAVKAICHQQSGSPDHVCTCMTPGGIGFGKVPGALTCRDTYEDIWDALQPVLASRGLVVRGEGVEP